VLPLKSMLKRLTGESARATLGPAVEKAKTCLECGDCMARCPYHLEIPKLLKERIAYYATVG
jgi:predicted aldo/keto reductase-like oxidoreductase